MSTTDLSLITSMSVREHFRDALETATHNQEVELSNTTFVYVVNLLTECCDSRALNAVSDDGRVIYTRRGGNRWALVSVGPLGEGARLESDDARD